MLLHQRARPRRVRSALLAGTVLAAAALTAAGCRNPFARDERAVLQVLYDGAEPFDLSYVRVRVGEAPVRYELGAGDFGTTEYATPHTGRLGLPTGGELPVQVSLVAAAGDTLGAVRLTLGLRPDYHFGIGISAGRARPQGFCLGTVVATPLRRPGSAAALEGDTLFVSYAALPAGAVC